MIACPHCGWAERGLRLPALCRHMIDYHDGQELVRSRADTTLRSCAATGWMLCWCGKRVTARGRNRAKHSQWAKHLEARGGLAAHLLEIALELDE